MAPRTAASVVALSMLTASSILGCGGAPATAASTPATPSPSEATPARESGSTPSTSNAPGQAFRETPEITRSVGTPKNVVVLWPRMSASSVNPQTKDLAQRLQQKVRDLAAQAAPGRAIDVRPDPERSCPRPNGCDAPTVSVLFLAEGGACAALVVVSKPGASPQRLVPWIGQARIKRNDVPFREPTESAVSVDDFASCAKMSEGFGDNEAEIVAAIKTVLP